MTTSPIIRRAAFCLSAIVVLTALTLPATAQTVDLKELRAKAAAFVAETNYIDARAPLEKLAAATPNDAQVQLWLGFSLLATAQVALTPAEARAYRVRARKAFEAAKTAGDDSLIVAGMIDSIPPDGGDDPTYAVNPKADAAMKKAETAFATGNMDEALSFYKETLKYDPTNYAATLYSGDAYMTKRDFSNAEIWYQRAISLNPYRETGYRYSATPLMKQKKYDEARARYIQAWITEPYNRLAISGIVQWARATNSKLGHPRIEPPKTEVGVDGKEKTTITLDGLMKGGSQMAWIAYTTTR
ncbi:MAG TPA: tetratricopeptide repeat protein, partial [Pyrinomonadaceae bacterium]|nr:tetratricopeptide repeat protein [Pyrinomonadaceae bacterium]